MPWRRRSWPLAFALPLSSVNAEPAEKRCEFRYEAPAECPSRATVAATIGRYAPATTFTDAGADDSIQVVITRTGQTFLAVIRAGKRGESETTRVVPAATCAETADATALVVAILIDPEAGLLAASEKSAPSTTETANVTAPVGVPTTPSPTATAPVLPSRPPPVTNDAARAPERRDPASASLSRWLFGLSVLGGVTSVMVKAPALELIVGPYAESASRAAFSPFFGAFIHYAPSPTLHDGASTATFRLLTGRAMGCPFRLWLDGGDGWIAPCASFELGRFAASGDATRSNGAASILWASAGTLARGQVKLGPVFATSELGVAFPFERDEFYFSPRTHTLYRVPGAAFDADLGLGVSFP